MSRLSCASSKQNSGSPSCDFDPGPDIGVIIAPVGATIATDAAGILEATWITGRNLVEASRWYPLIFPGYIETVTPTIDEPVFRDGNISGNRTKTRDGNVRSAFMLDNPAPCMTKALHSYDGQKWEAWVVTKNGYIRGTSSDGTLFDPFSIDFFAGNGASPTTGDEPSTVSYYIDFTDPSQWNSYPAFVKPTAFDPTQMEGIKDVYLTLISASSSAIVVDVKGDCDSVGFSDLVTADFTLTLDSSGATVSISGATESTSIAGRYSLAGTFTTAAHTLNLAQQPDMTTKDVESTGSIAVTPS